MNSRTIRQSTAAGLAAIATFAVLLGVNGLASQGHHEAVMAQSAAQQPAAAVQVVVVTGQRITRS